MPIIPISYLSKENRIVSLLCGCSFEQFEDYKKEMEIQREINTHTIPTSFFLKHLSENNHTISDIESFGRLTEVERKDFQNMLKCSNILNIYTVYELLHHFELPYDSFIDSYCEYLKGYVSEQK